MKHLSLKSKRSTCNQAQGDFSPIHLKYAVDLHPSKPIISLVPITCTTYCFQEKGHCYITIPIVFPANHKACLE